MPLGGGGGASNKQGIWLALFGLVGLYFVSNQRASLSSVPSQQHESALVAEVV